VAALARGRGRSRVLDWIAMPVHVPAPTQPTNKCPKCGAEGVVEQSLGNMTSYVCPKCGARWVAAG
jgi:DNA-directed RNA polymerase subunit M/transcription elongation factor TFIIS